MKKLIQISIAMLFSTSMLGQLNIEVTKNGNVEVQYLEPTHYFFKHPSTLHLSFPDTTLFNRTTFKYTSIGYVNDNYMPFPASQWGNNYKIIDVNGRNARATVEYSFSKRHLGPLFTHTYPIDLKYDKQNRISSAKIALRAIGVPDSLSRFQKTKVRNKQLWKYKYNAQGIKETKDRVSYVRDREGRLLYYKHGFSKLSNPTIYDSLKNQLRNEPTMHLGTDDLLKFVGLKYKNKMLTEFIAFIDQYDVKKIELEYDLQNRLIQIKEFKKGHEYYSTIIKLEYNKESGKIVRVLKTNFASNWNYKITGKYIWEYNYKLEKINSITKLGWDSFKWDNDYYENKPYSSSKEIKID